MSLNYVSGNLVASLTEGVTAMNQMSEGKSTRCFTARDVDNINENLKIDLGVNYDIIDNWMVTPKGSMILDSLSLDIIKYVDELDLSDEEVYKLTDIIKDKFNLTIVVRSLSVDTALIYKDMPRPDYMIYLQGIDFVKYSTPIINEEAEEL